MKPILTIAVPTLGMKRRAQHEACMESIQAARKGYVGKVRIIVYANGDVSYLSQMFDTFYNPVNIGATANFARAILECSTPWLWMVGDDDTLRRDAIETILADLEYPGGAEHFVYSSALGWLWPNLPPYGIPDVIGLTNITNSILYVPAWKKKMDVFYNAASTLLPVAVTLYNLIAAGDIKLIRFSDYSPVATWEDSKWNRRHVAEAMPLALELIPMQYRRRVAQELAIHVFQALKDSRLNREMGFMEHLRRTLVALFRFPVRAHVRSSRQLVANLSMLFVAPLHRAWRKHV
jgi:hypothetical protein